MTGKSGAKGGFTLVELLVVILIITSLAGMLVTQVGPVLDRIGRVRCQNRLANVGKLAFMWSEDHDGYLPCARREGASRAYESFQLLVNGMQSARRPELFLCPSADREAARVEDKKTGRFTLAAENVSYTWPVARTRVGEGLENAIISSDSIIADPDEGVREGHRGGINVLLRDTSVHWRPLEDLGLEGPSALKGFLEENGLTE
jgi:prepilin-type N-terminal cleavage/methylation domain-containing protein